MLFLSVKRLNAFLAASERGPERRGKMFARMTIFYFKVENIDDAIHLFRTSVLPRAKKKKGYRGACFLIDRVAGQSRVVTFWRSEKDALATEESRFYQEQLVRFIPYLSRDPMREGYEVVVHALSEPKPKKLKKSAPSKRKPRK